MRFVGGYPKGPLFLARAGAKCAARFEEYVGTIAAKTEEEHRRATEPGIAAEIRREELPAPRFTDGKLSVCAGFTAAKEVGATFTIISVWMTDDSPS